MHLPEGSPESAFAVWVPMESPGAAPPEPPADWYPSTSVWQRATGRGILLTKRYQTRSARATPTNRLPQRALAALQQAGLAPFLPLPAP